MGRRRGGGSRLICRRLARDGPHQGPFLLLGRQAMRRRVGGRPQGTLQMERGEVAGAEALVVGAVTQLREHPIGDRDRDTGWDWLNRSRHSFAGCYSTVIGVAIPAGVVRETVSDSACCRNSGPGDRWRPLAPCFPLVGLVWPSPLRASGFPAKKKPAQGGQVTQRAELAHSSRVSLELKPYVIRAPKEAGCQTRQR